MSKQLQQLRAALVAQFPERSNVIDGCILAVLSGEHVMMLGPPGTAKSALSRSIARAFGGTYFEYLMSRFTTPEEIFGALSLKALSEQDKYLRVTTGKLPDVNFAFLDEIWKSSSSIANSTLAILAERTFNNDGVVSVPLITAFAASNELPETVDLEAIYDRFLIRFHVGYLLRPASMKSMLSAADPLPSQVLTVDELRKIQERVTRIPVPDEVIDSLLSIREALRIEGVVASDRRYKKMLKVVRAAAFIDGEPKATTEHLAVLIDCLWRDPKDRPKIARVVGRIADPVGAQAVEVLDAARETAAKVGVLKTGDRKSYIAAAAQALENFQAQQRKLADLAKSAGRRAKTVIGEATTEIAELHADLARTVSAGLGLRSAR